MKEIVAINPPKYRVYGGWEYIGETKTHFLAIKIDCEGLTDFVLYALEKSKYKVKK